MQLGQRAVQRRITRRVYTSPPSRKTASLLDNNNVPYRRLVSAFTSDPPSLEAALDQHMEQVLRRFHNAGGVYPKDVEQAEAAVRNVITLRNELGLGEYIGNLKPNSGTPQLLLIFERGRFEAGEADEMVLKVYGRQRPSQGYLQHRWTQLGMPVVPTLAHGDEPTSWLLMEPVGGVDLSEELQRYPERLHDRTRELAAVVGELALSTPTTFPGSQSLKDGIFRHLRVVTKVLIQHGYAVPDDWEVHAEAAYDSGRKFALHGDLTGANVRVRPQVDRTKNPPTDLAVLDSAADGCVGAPEFDGARWAARRGDPRDPRTYEALCAAWMEGSRLHLDAATLRGHLAVELLMRAGVVEIVKSERGVPWHDRDPKTLALLDVYTRQRQLQELDLPMQRGAA